MSEDMCEDFAPVCVQNEEPTATQARRSKQTPKPSPSKPFIVFTCKRGSRTRPAAGPLGRCNLELDLTMLKQHQSHGGAKIVVFAVEVHSFQGVPPPPRSWILLSLTE